MAEHKLLRRFKQVYEGPASYLAKEVCYIEIEPNKIKTMYLFADGSTHEGPISDEKSFKLNMEGFDIVSTRKDGTESRTRFTGMLENNSFKEIVEELKVVPVEVTITVQEEGLEKTA